MRSARARSLSSLTLPRSPAIIRLVRPAAVSCFPPPIEGVEHLVTAPLADPPVRAVGVDGVGRTRSQLDTGRLLPFVGEPAHVAQCWGQAVAVTHQGGEHPAGLHRADLTVITDQDHLAPGGSGRPHELVEGESAGQAGLVDDHQLVRAEAPPDHLVHGGGDALAQGRAGSRDTGK